MTEFERTYLVKKMPERLADAQSKEIIDVYIPASRPHPVLRLRKNGTKYEMTKKSPVREGDASEQTEQTISLEADEFEALAAVPGKRVHKIRYFVEVAGRTAEIDVFQGDLKGLVLADFEFEFAGEKNTFRMPDFCLADVTQEAFIAGGMLCGKKYEDIEKELDCFGYKKLL